jgi:phage baseplate assembly protein W
MATEIRLHPIDFETDVAVGIDLPMMSPTGASFKLNYTTLDQAVANAKNLLFTNKGERIMLPNFGCNLKATLFENITEDLTNEIDDLIRTNFSFWLPYIFINELIVQPHESIPNGLYIQLTMSLDGNRFDTRSIQLDLLNV